jgi:hypothetical protein
MAFDGVAPGRGGPFAIGGTKRRDLRAGKRVVSIRDSLFL